jgi:hypothetical protein
VFICIIRKNKKYYVEIGNMQEDELFTTVKENVPLRL